MGFFPLTGRIQSNTGKALIPKAEVKLDIKRSVKALLFYSTAKLQAGIMDIDMKINTMEKNVFNCSLAKMDPCSFLRVTLMPRVHLHPEGLACQTKIKKKKFCETGAHFCLKAHGLN